MASANGVGGSILKVEAAGAVVAGSTVNGFAKAAGCVVGVNGEGKAGSVVGSAGVTRMGVTIAGGAGIAGFGAAAPILKVVADAGVKWLREMGML